MSNPKPNERKRVYYEEEFLIELWKKVQAGDKQASIDFAKAFHGPFSNYYFEKWKAWMRCPQGHYRDVSPPTNEKCWECDYIRDKQKIDEMLKELEDKNP
jgi:hypothetical protein